MTVWARELRKPVDCECQSEPEGPTKHPQAEGLGVPSGAESVSLRSEVEAYGLGSL